MPRRHTDQDACPGSPVTWTQWLAAIMTGTGLAVMCWSGLLTDQDLNGGDTWPYFMPQKVVLAESLQNNRIPGWHPLTGLGYPLLAESQAGVFYPPTQILYRLFEVNRAFSVSTVLHYALAFVFAWRFMRSQGVSATASQLAALVYVYGWFPARISLEWSIIGGVWLPLTLWRGHEFLTRPGRMRFALLASALAVHLLAGHFTLAFITELCLIAYAVLMRVFTPQDRRPAWSTVSLVPAAVATGLLLSAAQILPTMELKQISQRDTSQTRPDRPFDPGYGHMPPLYLSQLVASWTWWHTPEIRSSGRLQQLPGSISSATNAVEAHFYVGLIPLGLIVLDLLFRKHRSAAPSVRRIWWTLILLSVFYATGWLLPVTGHLPGFSYFMGPGRYTIVATLGAAVLCGLSLDHLAGRRASLVPITIVIAGLTWFDLHQASRAVADAVPVPEIWPHRHESWIRRYFTSQPPRTTRVLAPGPNVACLFGTAAVPQYLGIGPAVYFSEAFDLARSPEDERFLSDEQHRKLRDLAVTHVLTDTRLPPSDWLEFVQAGPDALLNRIWGDPYAVRYLYAVRDARDRLESAPPDALTSWSCTVDEATVVEFDVTLSRPGILQLHELDYPGWMVFVDGRPAQDEAAAEHPRGGLVRTVPVPAGTHRVRWEFRSKAIRHGIQISVLTALVLWGGVFLRLPRRHNARNVKKEQ